MMNKFEVKNMDLYYGSFQMCIRDSVMGHDYDGVAVL